MEASAEVFASAFSMADRYLVFARDALLDSPSALPHFLGAAKIGAQMRDRGTVLQVWGAVWTGHCSRCEREGYWLIIRNREMLMAIGIISMPDEVWNSYTVSPHFFLLRSLPLSLIWLHCPGSC